MPPHETFWTRYFDAVEGKGPRETLTFALDAFERERASMSASSEPVDLAQAPLAVDLGCGSGRDTFELLRRGWRVIAIDASRVGLQRLEQRVPPPWRERLRVVCAEFHEALWPAVHLVNASFSIPHCTPTQFRRVWGTIAGTLVPGGRFAGQVFGINDSWTRATDLIPRTFHTRHEVAALLRRASLAPEHVVEHDRDGVDAHTRWKHWHVFHLVARRACAAPA
ncbi:MAG: class I SAM-dependent methyltransferase [Planctomycetota bacterium]|nr:class I SAM-dependent methyltransferase [Planctomycetota bacterium]